MTGRIVGSRLFLSCDLVGSTAFKQSRSKQWVPHFLQFYNSFPGIVSTKIAESGGNLDPSGLSLWKPVGDELIFTFDVSSAEQVCDLVFAWVAAMNEYENTNQAGLATKGSAFLATFPLPDRQVAIPRKITRQVTDEDALTVNEAAVVNQEDGYVFDYLGPSIDTGFRVAELSDRRFFTLSLEVAWALAHAGRARGGDVELTLMGTYELRGVWRGRQYAVFAVDRVVGRGDPVTLALNRLTGARAANHDDVIELAKACLADSSWPCKVYLPDSADCPPFARDKTALFDAVQDVDRYANQQMTSAELRDERSDGGLDSDPPID